MAVEAFVLSFNGVLASTEPRGRVLDETLQHYAEICEHDGFCISPDVREKALKKGSRAEKVIAFVLTHQGFIPPEDNERNPFTRIISTEFAARYGELALAGLPEQPGIHRGLNEVIFRFGAPRQKGVVTTDSLQVVEAFMRKNHYASDGFTIVSGDETPGQSKPDPYPYLLAAECMGIAPDDCLALEHTPAGAVAARLAGYGTVLGTPTTHTARELIPYVDWVIQLDELQGVVEKL